MVLYVARHAQTDWNKEGRLQGRSGPSINKYGIKQAENLGEALRDIKFSYVISSSQLRTIVTAEIATNMKVTVDKRLDVFDLGQADGLKKDEVQMLGGIPNPKIYKGVEDVHSYIKRIFELMNELEARFRDSDVNIFLCGHKCTTGCIGAYFEGFPDDGNFLKYSLSNGNYKIYTSDKIKS